MTTETDSPTPNFLFVVCQVGAEIALKAEMARLWPDFRASFSRPGFVTFRLPNGASWDPAVNLGSTFARTYGLSLGKASGETGEDLAVSVWQLAASQRLDHLHVWERDRRMPGSGGFEPGPTVLAEEIAAKIVEARPAGLRAPPTNQVAAAGQSVLDCILVEPGEWWLGTHQAASPPSRWPGGVWRANPPTEPISRAYFKMEEALKWSRLPIERNDICAELGAAPGGAAQALLARGASVIGIDPAEVDPRLAEYPGFTHVRKRAADMKRREFKGVRWLSVDSNVAPESVLAEVAAIVTHESVHVRGLLLTLKLIDWDFADRIPEYTEQIRSWGYEYIRCRQLSYNRREFCVAALRKRSMRRPPRK